MSASTKRKNRLAEIEAGTYKKQNAQREREEKQAKENRTIIICACVAAVIILSAILLKVIPEAVEKHNYSGTVAVTVGDRDYSPAEVSYLYASLAMQMGGNANEIGTQAFPGQMQDRSGNPITSWREYLLDSVYTQLSQQQILLRYARENGIELTKEEKAAVEEQLKQLETSATSYGYPSANAFLSMNYGTGVNVKTVRTMELESALATKAYTAFQESLSFTPEELTAKYSEDLADSYDLFTYAFYSVKPETAEGAEVTDEAKAEAEATAESILTSYQDAADVEDPFERFNGYIEEELGESAEIREGVSGSDLGSAYGDWLKEAGRQPGDVTKVQNGDNWIAVLFLGREDGADYNTVNVRHILVRAEQNEDGTWSDEAIAAAKAKAERILAEWEAGDRTEESFAALAEQYSEDGGSNTNGGLYENVYRGRMVDEFNDFCFAEGRKAGDTGIVHGNNGGYDGYHVMYFSGEGELYRDLLARDSLAGEAANELLGQEISVTVGADEWRVFPNPAPAAVEEVPAAEEAAPAEG